MPRMPRERSARVRQRWPWRRRAVLFRRAAFGCYATAVSFVGLAISRPWCAWLAVAAGFAGLWCQRAAMRETRHAP